MRYLKHFGGRLTKERIAQYEKSPNWIDGTFRNLESTTMEITPSKIPGLLYQQFFKRKGREPIQPLPIQPFDKEAFLAPSDEVKMIWYGHSVVLLRIEGKTVLIDPMLGPDASPIAPFPVKRFSENTLNLINDFPEIDILLMTHDHYDHIDLSSFEKLKPKVSKYVTTLGTARHYEDWGVAEEDIFELDWWDSIKIEGLKIHCTPSRHFAGRGGNNRAKSLWGGWTIKSESENLYFSGDGGYGNHFKEVGERLGPFDFGFMECGQYNELWHQIHMYPEESVQAAIDAKVKNIMPVHWAGFALAMHTWQEPVERFVAEANAKSKSFITPQIGEMFNARSDSKKDWWNQHL
ncbi:MAG: MBL fold metallo-hydrolase [Bacteroidia bacterium]|nr:MBL fold metallo-hydrolase [Bacteroidia bacterium]NNJ54940.1 hypothetical protein [Bacteroidia bacterium]